MSYARLRSPGVKRVVRHYSSDLNGSSQYAKTIPNLNIGSHTKVIFQGFTGRQATFDAQQSIDYGTNIVGGTNPKRDGEHLGRPLFKTVREAQAKLKADASCIYVPASGAVAAIEEAVEAEIPLIVSVAEFIPLHDMYRIHSILKSQSKSRLVGANCPGMINPHGKCRLGFPPIPFYKPGEVAIVAKSGTLSYEAVASTTAAGVGQSIVVGIGGDPLPGTDFVDVLTILEHDEKTKAIVIVGEIGGYAEYRAAEWIENYKKRTQNPKPIAGLVGGFQARLGRVMGHAGASFYNDAETARSKYEALEKVGVVMTDHPSKFGNLMIDLLKNPTARNTSAQNLFTNQRRSFHTSMRRNPFASRIIQQQRRSYIVSQETGGELLREYGLSFPASASSIGIQITIDRNTYTPSLTVSSPAGSENAYTTPLQYYSTDDQISSAVSEAANKFQGGIEDQKELTRQVTQLFKLYKEKEAEKLTVDLTYNAAKSTWQATKNSMEFNNSAYRTSKRQNEIWQKRMGRVSPTEAEAIEYGIVYVPLAGNGNIGTIVNGAGLAMNTTDSLVALGGRPSNFLDTGGKATSETVSQSFRTVLTDPNVTAIFVNIFGGLTLGDMIAKGVILAYKEVGIKIPVVCRIRGTNEKEGQKLIAESGLPIEPFQDFEEAARRVIELANEGSSKKDKQAI